MQFQRLGCGMLIIQFNPRKMKAIAARALQRLHGSLKAARVIIHAMHLVAIIKQLQASVRPNVASGASHSYMH